MNSKEILTYFSKWIESETGIIYQEHNLYQLQDRLDQLVRHFKLESPIDLWKKVEAGGGSEFRTKLIDISTNNETSFFRDAKFFECLERTVLPGLVKDCGGLANIKIWSVASSSGQEPYSLAMLLVELGKKINQLPPKIMATDISEGILAKATAGIYSEIEMGRGLSEERRKNYFKPDNSNTWLLNADMRALVNLKKLNLISQNSLPGPFDLILCRNVLIYQKVEAKVQIINRLSGCLRPEGIFLMGSGESMIGLSNEFRQVLTDGVAIYSRKETEKKSA